jgi:hypothetical protein
LIYNREENANGDIVWRGMYSVRKPENRALSDIFGNNRIVVTDPVVIFKELYIEGVSHISGDLPSDEFIVESVKRKRDDNDDTLSVDTPRTSNHFHAFMDTVQSGVIDRKRLRRLYPEICAKFPLFVSCCILDTVRNTDIPNDLFYNNNKNPNNNNTNNNSNVPINVDTTSPLKNTYKLKRTPNLTPVRNTRLSQAKLQTNFTQASES